MLVSNVPTAVNDATADVNMFLIIGALRNFNTSILALREGKWKGQPPPKLGHDPQGKVLGILGMGGIGRNLKKKAEAFGLEIIYHNRRKLSDELADGAEYVSFDELLGRSDVISLNLPLNVGVFSFYFFFVLVEFQPAAFSFPTISTLLFPHAFFTHAYCTQPSPFLFFFHLLNSSTEKHAAHNQPCRIRQDETRRGRRKHRPRRCHR